MTLPEPLYNPEVYTPDLLPTWLAIAERQAAKDAVLVPRITRHFRKGRILELGAGTGHIARLLRKAGWDVVPTDYSEFFVEHMRQSGLDARQVDATRIRDAGLGQFPNIFCQSITPFITLNTSVLRQSYASAYDALQPGGRLVLIHAQAPRRELAATMQQHQALATAAGFVEVFAYRNQLLPSVAYRPPFTAIAAAAERLLGTTLGQRFVLVATRPPRQETLRDATAAT